jgi:hypothetical protein
MRKTMHKPVENLFEGMEPGDIKSSKIGKLSIGIAQLTEGGTLTQFTEDGIDDETASAIVEHLLNKHELTLEHIFIKMRGGMR